MVTVEPTSDAVSPGMYDVPVAYIHTHCDKYMNIEKFISGIHMIHVI